MGLARKPQSGIAARVLPPPLYRALTHVFSQGVAGCMLVGGTALAGYYAGHRRSDDLDLFTADDISHRATVLAVKSLGKVGATFADERASAGFYHATCHLDGHDFTAQVVLDEHLFEVGTGLKADDGVVVADPRTLLKMKAATLISRGSEKDLYDLAWLLEQDREVDVPSLIELGNEIDGGMNAETLLANLVGTELQVSSCDFSLTESADDVLAIVTRLQKTLVRSTESYLLGRPPPPIASLIRKLRS